MWVRLVGGVFNVQLVYLGVRWGWGQSQEFILIKYSGGVGFWVRTRSTKARQVRQMSFRFRTEVFRRSGRRVRSQFSTSNSVLIFEVSCWVCRGQRRMEQYRQSILQFKGGLFYLWYFQGREVVFYFCVCFRGFFMFIWFFLDFGRGRMVILDFGVFLGIYCGILEILQEKL